MYVMHGRSRRRRSCLSMTFFFSSQGRKGGDGWMDGWDGSTLRKKR